ncbi:hypothetical protein BCV71DRAFT_242310 [Rhizopus microsporus]|uniref:Uncharacterized protein n=1 Tax=Rhizopus microsporus TaxID=58291 RepID=A0A1X0S7N2_RHIZD|nr:hypothetical protein BCV71DRAFT_242310 [Rhizopus microsporus]
MVTKDDVDIEGIDHDLERLQDEFGKFSFTRLKRDLELASIRNGNRTFVELLNAHLSNAPLEISRTIATILNSSHMTPADLITLKRPYLSSNPPSVHYLCNYDLMNMVDDATFLLACASTMNDEQPLQAQQQEITQVQYVLRELYTALAPKTSVGSITGQPVVFDVIKKCIKHKYNHFAPEIQMALQRTWVDRMLYLVQLNYTIPVLKYFEKEGKELDNSIIIHFVKKLLKLTQGPYSIAFTEHLINIIGLLGENLALIKDIQKSLNDFFEQVINGPYPIDESLQQNIRAIRKHF